MLVPLLVIGALVYLAYRLYNDGYTESTKLKPKLKTSSQDKEVFLLEEIRDTGKYLQTLRQEYAKEVVEKYVRKKLSEPMPDSYEGVYDPSLHVMDNFPLPFWIYDIGAARICFANLAAQRLWNVSSLKDMHKKNFGDNSEATKKQFAHWESVWESDASHVFEKQWTYYPNGKPVPTNVIVACHRFPTGRMGFYVIATAVKQVENATEAELLRSHESTRHSGDMVSLYNMQGQLLFQNPAAHKLGLAVCPQPVSTNDPKFDGFTFLPYIVQRDVVQDIIESISAYKNSEYQVKVKLGNATAYHKVSIFIVDDPVSGKKCALLSENDITALILQKKKLRQEELTKKELLKAKARAEIFLGAMSHEIRTPLHGIIGLSQALLDQKSLRGEPLRLAENIASTGDHLLNLINNTLDLTKLEAHRLELKVAPYNPYMSVKKVMEWLEPLAYGKKIFVKSKIPVDLPELLGDLSRVEQILLNLLSNAIKFTNRGCVEISAHTSTNVIHATSNPKPNEHAFFLHPNKAKTPPSSHPSSPLLTRRRKSIAPVSIDCCLLPPGNSGSTPASNSSSNSSTPSSSPLLQSKSGTVLPKSPQEHFFADPTPENNFVGTGTYVHFCVTDSGIGISEKDLPKLFQRFTQLEQSYTREYEGSGLGLSICKELAFLMGGAIGVSSIEGEGSTFWVSVPFLQNGTNPDTTVNFSLPHISVGIIDEREHVIDTYSYYFKQWKLQYSYGPKLQSSLESYVEELTAQPPNVLFVSSSFLESYPTIIQDLMKKFPKTKIYLNQPRSEPIYDAPCPMITTPLHITDLASVFHRFVEPSVLSPKLRPKHAKMEQLENVNNNKVEEIRKIPKIEGPEPLNQLEIAKILANAYVLLVEDNPINQMVAVNFLKGCGITKIRVENNGKKGFEAYKEKQPDIILMDILMPEMNGFESTEAIRKYEAENHLLPRPVLALTASHTGEVYDKMTKVGMNDILSKPFKKDELLQKVRNMLKIDEDNNNSFTTITTTITTTISTTSPLTPRLPKKQ